MSDLYASLATRMAANRYGRHHRRLDRAFPDSTLRVLDGAASWSARRLTGQHRESVRTLIAAGVMADDLPETLWGVASAEMRPA